MGRILALDFGTKRTGIAVTDPLQLIATSLQAIETHKLINFLKDYFLKEKVEKIILGLPTRWDGSPTDNTENVKNFYNLLIKTFPDMLVDFQDEYNTSKMAVSSMVAGGVKKKDRRDKMKIDEVSAVLILQSYMNTNL